MSTLLIYFFFEKVLLTLNYFKINAFILIYCGLNNIYIKLHFITSISYLHILTFPLKPSYSVVKIFVLY